MPDDPRDTDPRARDTLGPIEPAFRALDYLASVIRSWVFWEPGDGWGTISPRGDEHHFLDCCLVDEQVGYAVGEDGVIIKTEDGGQSWTHLEHNLTTVKLWGVHFVDQNTGYVVGSEATVLKTTNGGNTWTQLTVPAGAALHIRGVHFTDPQTGVIVGGSEHLWQMEDRIGFYYQAGYVYRTSDGGQTWLPAEEVPPVLPFLKAVSLTDGGVGTAVGGSQFWSPMGTGPQMTSVIARTLDGGATWHHQANPFDIPDSYYDKPLEDVALHSPNQGMAVGGLGVPPIYTNDGETWERGSREDCLIQWLTSTAFIDGNTAVAVGENCASAGVYRSTNAGQNWSLVDYGSYTSLRGVSFGSGNRGVAVGRLSTVIISEDAGETWYASPDFPVAPATDNEMLQGVHFIDGDTGFAVGWFGSVLKTTDGGGTWERVAGLYNSLRSVYFADPQVGFVVGSGLFKTTDGGLTWEEYRTNDNGQTWSTDCTPDCSGAHLCSAVHFGSPQTGLVVRDRHTNPLLNPILRTTDGGTTWSRVALPMNLQVLRMRDVHFSGPETAFIVGQTASDWNGAILRSEDGGVTWSMQISEAVSDLRAVHFPTSDVGYAVGSYGGSSLQDGGCVLKTIDGGNTWARVEIRVAGHVRLPHLNGVFFVDPETGWIVGDSPEGGRPKGIILYTSDGGNSWTEQLARGAAAPLEERALNDVALVSDRTGVIVGDKGTILRTVSGGV